MTKGLWGSAEGFWEGAIILDFYPGGSITVLIRRTQKESESEEEKAIWWWKQRLKWYALKMVERAINQGT